ncbi:ATP-binding protein [Salinibius halmophilus]|uniref:ATP-binding protein n=1 Tax=Salinibius halmophilus TaxID=1853216 RepID=UPI000E65F8B7|nr:ATP-binding protein [Salinibius halmophilus]
MQSLWRYVVKKSLGTLVGVSLFVFVVLVVVAASIQRQLVDRQLQAAGKSYHLIVNEQYQQLQERLEQFAANAIVVNALVDYNGRQAYLPSFIENLSLASSERTPLAVVDFRGEVIASNNGRIANWYPDTSLWLDRVLEDGQSWTFIEDGHLYLASPVKINRSPEGAFVARVSLDYLMQQSAFSRPDRALVLLDDKQTVLYSTTNDLVLEQALELPISGWFSSAPQNDLALQPVILQDEQAIGLLQDGFVSMLVVSVAIVLGVFFVISLVTLSSVKQLLHDLKSAMSRDLQTLDTSEVITNHTNVSELAEVVRIFHHSITGMRAATTSKVEIQSILDSLDAAVLITDDQLVLTSCNQTAEELLRPAAGSSVPHSMGLTNDSSLFGEEARVEHSLNGSTWLWTRADKQNANNEKSGFVFVGTDITLVRQAEQELKLLKLAVDTANNGIIISEYSDAQPLVFVNHGFELITGFKAEDVLGKKCDFLQGPETNTDSVKKLANAIRHQKAVEVELANYRADGSLFWNQLSLSPVKNDQGETTHYIGIQSDITDRREAEQQLIQAMHEAESANRLKSQFVANMSHEIRTPMNAITGMAELALATGLSSKQRSYIEKIQLSSEALLSIINDILDFSKIEANKLELDYHPFSLPDVLATSCAIFGEQSRAKGVPIWVEANPSQPCNFIGDSLRIQQILNNLLSNALKFTESGDIRLSVAYQASHLELTVSDTGIGMKPEQLKLLFKPFQQADSSTSRKFGGTGLGLNISQRLANLMGGNIVANSVPGEGTVFTLNLPIAEDPQASNFELPPIKVALQMSDAQLAEHLQETLMSAGITLSQDMAVCQRVIVDDEALAGVLGEKALLIGRRESDNAAMTMPFTPYQLIDTLVNKAQNESAKLGEPQFEARILVAEDNDINWQIVEELLGRCGIKPAHARDGAQAVLMALEQSYDLIFMDVQMPVKDGLQAATEIRQHGFEAPIVALTANAMMSDRQSTEAAGMNAHLSKPFKPNELYELLRQLLPHKLLEGAYNPKTVPEKPADLPTAEQEVTAEAEFNESYALANAAGSIDVLKQVVAQFVSNHADDIQTAAAEYLTDRDASHRRLHTLKGLTAMLVQNQVTDAVMQLEQAVKAGEDVAEVKFTRVNEQLQSLVRALKEWLSRQ